MCNSGGLGKRFKESLNPGREFERSLSPDKAIKDSLEPIMGVEQEMPEVQEVKAPQAKKTPDVTALMKRNKNAQSGMGVGTNTLLTSPSGIGTPVIGSATLLGG